MTDHHDRMRAAPDPQQAEALRRRLHARLAGATVHIDPEPNDPALVTLEEHNMSTDPTSDRRGGRRVLLAAAAVVVTIGAVALIASFGAADDSEPASNSDAPAPLSDELIAAATLLAADEYAPGFNQYTPTGTDAGGAGMKMDRDIAAKVPACAPLPRHGVREPRPPGRRRLHLLHPGSSRPSSRSTWWCSRRRTPRPPCSMPSPTRTSSTDA